MYRLRRVAIVAVFMLGLLVGCGGTITVAVKSALTVKHAGIPVSREV
jgi:hypothetical protein